jgi:hypothetical protein
MSLNLPRSGRRSLRPITTRSDDDIADDIERRLALADPLVMPGGAPSDDNYSMISLVGASLCPSSAAGGASTSRGEFTPSTVRAQASPTFVRGVSVGRSKIPTPRGSSKVLPIVLLSSEDINNLCLGHVGSSGHFCLVPKIRGKNHCGTVSHNKTKQAVEPNTFWAPGGDFMGRPTAFENLYVQMEDLTSTQLDFAERGVSTLTVWARDR